MLGLTSAELQDLLLSVGTHQGERRLSPVEVARLVKKALDAGMSRKECGDVLGISPTQIGVFLKLLSLDVEVQHLADWQGTKNASVPFSTLAEISRLSATDQLIATAAVIQHGMTWKEVVQLVQVSTRSNWGIETCIDNILRLRPEVEVRHLFVGSIGSTRTRQLLDSIRQSQRDALMTRILSRLVGSSYDARGRLGSREFTILSHHDLPRLLDMSPDELEQAVNSLLKEMV